MVVAVIAVNVVAVAVHDVVDVVVVLHRLMTALRAVDVLRIVTFADMVAGAHALSYGPR